jgi:hypothetical protein
MTVRVLCLLPRGKIYDRACALLCLLPRGKIYDRAVAQGQDL